MIKKYRHKETKRRIEAVQYNGENAEEVSKFVQFKASECRGEYLVIISKRVEKGDFVIRKVLDVLGVLDIDFEVVNEEEFKKKYKERKEGAK